MEPTREIDDLTWHDIRHAADETTPPPNDIPSEEELEDLDPEEFEEEDEIDEDEVKADEDIEEND
jgi:hypothetical protein